MGKRWFEAVLSLLAGRQRAAEITGDLQEQHPARPRFWWAAFQVLISFIWRPLAGILGAQAALISAGLSFGNSWHQAGSPMMTSGWQAFSMEATYVAIYAWPVACMATAKFGRRHPVAAVSCTLAALLTLISCSFATPPVQAVSAGTILLIISIMSSTASNRGSLLLICRSVFVVWLADYAGTKAYFELLRFLQLPFGKARTLSAALTLTTWLLSVVVGWLALGTRSARDAQQHSSSRRLATL